LRSIRIRSVATVARAHDKGRRANGSYGICNREPGESNRSAGASDHAGRPDPSETASAPSADAAEFLWLLEGKGKIVETSIIDTSLNVGNLTTLSNAVHPHKLDGDDHLKLCGQRVPFPKNTRLSGYPYPHVFPTLYPIFMQDKGKTIVDAWAIGFALGLGGEAWAPILLATPKPIITPIMAVNPQLSKMLFRLSPQERRKVRATAHLHIRAAVNQLYAVTRAARR